MTKPKYMCRFPGCTKGWDFAGVRGRHEGMTHRMKNGVVPQSAPAAIPAQMNGKAPASDTPCDHLQRAIDQLENREAEVMLGLEMYDRLSEELQTVRRAKAILIKASADLQTPDSQGETWNQSATSNLESSSV